MNFCSCVYPSNHYLNQNIKNYRHPRRCPLGSLEISSLLKVVTVLTYPRLVSPSFKLHIQAYLVLLHFADNAFFTD